MHTVVSRWGHRNQLNTGPTIPAYDTAFVAALAATLASMLIRDRMIRGREPAAHKPRARYERRTAALACAWSLDCGVALAGTILAADSPWIALCLIASGAALLSITPPKIVPDVDPP